MVAAVDNPLSLVFRWRSPISRLEPEYHPRPSADACRRTRAVATDPSQLATGKRTSPDGAEAEITAAPTANTTARTITVISPRKGRASLPRSLLALAHCPTACPTSLLVSHSPIPPTEEALFRRMDMHIYLMIPRVRKWEDICRFVVDSPVS